MRVCQEIEQKMAATEKQIELNRTEISSNLEFLLADSPADEEQSHKDLLPRELADAMPEDEPAGDPGEEAEDEPAGEPGDKAGDMHEKR